MSYPQLTQEQRYQIYPGTARSLTPSRQGQVQGRCALKKTGHSGTEIADVIGVHKSTVSRELRRNRGGCGYRPQQAQTLGIGRRRKAVLRISAKTWIVVEKLLRQEWSPEQISGRLKQEQKICLSQEGIYQQVLANKRTGGDLYKHLRCQKQRRKRYGTYNRRGKLLNCHSIEERPAMVNHRKRLGDWEVDRMFGKDHKQTLVTLTERKSRFTLLGKLPQRTAQAVRDQIYRLLLPVQDKVYTLTSDHGKEFAYHEQIAQLLQLKYYFAHPYAAWERGTNENTHGLLRQYFPKKHDLQQVAHKELDRAMSRLNFRPRKSLRFKTPFEVFCHSSVALTR